MVVFKKGIFSTILRNDLNGVLPYNIVNINPITTNIMLKIDIVKISLIFPGRNSKDIIPIINKTQISRNLSIKILGIPIEKGTLTSSFRYKALLNSPILPGVITPNSMDVQ